MSTAEEYPPLRWLGRGIDFPFKIEDDGSFRIVDGLDIVNASMKQILFTVPGERVMNPFGSRLPELVFEPMDQVFLALANQYIHDSVGKYEKRTRIRKIDFVRKPDFNEVDIVVNSELTKASGLRINSLVIPFRRVNQGLRGD